jgi:hypothetical protein
LVAATTSSVLSGAGHRLGKHWLYTPEQLMLACTPRKCIQINRQRLLKPATIQHRKELNLLVILTVDTTRFLAQTLVSKEIITP